MRLQLSKFACSRRFSSYILLFATLVVIYLEFFEYYSVHWHQLKCENQNECVRILLVADPQIIGLHNEIIHWATPFSLWDSDNFLKKTYGFAKKFANPHIVIFLGDLMDEGYTAPEKEFQYYAQRLSNIYQYKENLNKIQYIFIPGDNDIGGEGVEAVSLSRINRFDQTYGAQDVFHVRNLTFFKINRFIRSIPPVPKVDAQNEDDQTRITISHMPLIFIPSVFSEKVLAKVRPHLLFAAHEHNSMIVNSDNIVQVRQVVPVTPSDPSVHRLYLKMDSVFEIIVPTCSYRMGTQKIGYGYVLIENNEVQYTVLWSPSRLRQLLYYVAVVLIMLFLTVYFKCPSSRPQRANNNNNNKK